MRSVPSSIGPLQNFQPGVKKRNGGHTAPSADAARSGHACERRRGEGRGSETTERREDEKTRRRGDEETRRRAGEQASRRKSAGGGARDPARGARDEAAGPVSSRFAQIRRARQLPA
ncbi:hypothetical protein DIJ61_17315 [Burkholderia pseudomallei]|nr:hypothetical protein BPC006_II3000 [Burkholderia pseudomallei BPC006]PNW95548.1 hypothetical protein CF640_13250 [Burkholderia pseudomallei]PNX21484.1 hypothetical protein CF645_13995 [Burkholderia pseudomallei]TOZ59772.1 hypothetical protein DIJ60_10555 [Burkholderia pseudomallei]TPA20778.1 hypothetical protein DIJ61_17315 [Burkholderia pseudomallei]